jgi:flagellar FliL protein
MKKFLNPKILIPTVVTVVLIGMVAYILLAPETWWKPVYIEFGAEEASANTSEVQAATPENHAPEITPPVESSHLEPATTIAPQLVMPAIQPGQGVMYQLEPKVVNLAEPGGLRYLQAGVVLEFHPTVKEYYLAKMSGETDTGHGSEGEVAFDPFQEAMDAMRPVIDDIVTTILSSKTFNEISTIEGKQALKQELMVKVNAALGYQGVVNIYFTEFVVQ